MGILEVAGHQLIKILRAGMNVRLRNLDVPNVEFFPCGLHQLHDADRAYPTLRILIELRFLKPLGGEHQWIEIVLLAILLKIRHRLSETFEFGTLRVVVNLLRTLHVLLEADLRYALLPDELLIEVADHRL